MAFRNVFSRVLSTFLFAGLFIFGTLFTLFTAYQIPVDPVQTAVLIPGTALLFSLPFILKKPFFVQLPLFIAGTVLFIIYIKDIGNGAAYLFDKIFTAFQKTFPRLDVLHFAVEYDKTPDLLPFNLLLSGLLAFFGTAAFNRQLPVLIPVEFTIPVLFCCLTAQDTIPAPLPLAILSLSFLWLVLSQSPVFVSRRSSGLRLLILVPAALFILLVFLLTDPENYKRTSLQEQANTLFYRITSSLPGPGRGRDPSSLGTQPWNSDPLYADLTKAGPQEKTGDHVMDMTASWSGQIYLKGASYTDYTGSAWTGDPGLFPEDIDPRSVWTLDKTEPSRTLTLVTDDTSDILYSDAMLTALPRGASCAGDLYLENRWFLRKYTLSLSRKAPVYPDGYRDYVYDTYTQLPDSTREALRKKGERVSAVSFLPPEAFPSNTLPLWDQLMFMHFLAYPESLELEEFREEGYDRKSLPEMIYKIVSASASYSLDTPALPEGEEFASWFLWESETGYCMHFASAAVVLLRYFGIPARFATGYTVQADAGALTAVTQDDAHAWAEYFDDERGWTILDPTPGGANVHPVSPSGPAERETAATGSFEDETPETRTRNTRESDAASSETEEKESSYSGTPGGEKEGFHIGRLIILLLLIPAILLLLRRLIRFLLNRYLLAPEPKTAVVRLYRRMKFFADKTKRELPQEAEAIALKARFSNHGSTTEELASMIGLYESYTERLKVTLPRFRSWIYRLFLFL
ncbi:MAG: transglutaminase domain-containing protein [Lachnospiraceae bacterium]|nr:transglutaminase domain-containing protein [Lachnospiraceae bacterium]